MKHGHGHGNTDMDTTKLKKIGHGDTTSFYYYYYYLLLYIDKFIKFNQQTKMSTIK